jgi:DNA modification methylase
LPKFTLYNDDCLNALRNMEDNSIDSCVTDPPYGLSFMGKSWDYDVPKTEIWKEVFRVLKPGGHVLAFFGSRTYHRGVVQIEDAGFEIRDQIMWLYGSGFPKSHNVGNGWGTALKPAHEPIVVARKPITQSVAKNVLEHGTGAINIDECRVELDGDYKSKPNGRPSQTGLPDNYDPEKANQPDDKGRWPANVLHDGSDEVVQNFPNTSSREPGIRKKPHQTNSMAGTLNTTGKVEVGYGDSGSAARFFYCAKASKSDKDEGLEDFLAKKIVTWQTGNGASGKPSSMSAGRDTEYKNIHPTVKPTDLMKYLCRLVTPKNGTVIDPFMGSGSTGKAAAQEGFKFIGIEMSPEYFEIAEARVKHAYEGKTVSLEDFFA